MLVTGATGFLGSCVTDALLQRGADVVALVRDWTPSSRLIGQGSVSRVVVVRGDITDSDCLERTLLEHDVETVVHLAAQPLVGVANAGPNNTFETNIAGTWRLLDACRRAGSKPDVIVASSDKAYGASSNLPYEESEPLRGLHPYDVSKSCCDLLAQAYAHSYDLPIVIARCGNFYGPGDLNFSRLVPGTIRSVLRGERPVIRSDGKFARDYLFVEDAARAYLVLCEAIAQRPELRGEAFNFGNGHGVSVSELVEMILAVSGSPLKPSILNEVRNEIKDQYLCIDKSREVLGWAPEVSLADGLRRSVDWYAARLKVVPPVSNLKSHVSEYRLHDRN